MNKWVMKKTLVLLMVGAVLSGPSHATENKFSKFFGELKKILSNKKSKFVYDARNIPIDLMREVLPHLSAMDLVSFSQLNKDFQEFAEIELAKAKLAFLIGDVEKIKAGSFIMGPDPREFTFGYEPRSFVRIEKDYWMMVNPVTQEQYEAVMGKDRNRSLYTGAKRPVTNLTRAEEAEYISNLNRQIKDLWKVIHPQAEEPQEGTETEVMPQFEKPTEEQWEYATTEPLRDLVTGILDGREVQITAKHMKYSGTNENDNLKDYADFGRPWNEGPLPVGTEAPNKRGIRGMSGGIWEVTSSPYGESGSDFVIRGGVWSRNARICRSAYRYFVRDDDANESVGFRLVSIP